jgi:hypothetical protein
MRNVADGQSCSVLGGKSDQPIFMDQPAAELHTEWVVAQNIGCFQELIDAETEEGKYRILHLLLSRLKKTPVSGRGSSPSLDGLAARHNLGLSFPKAIFVSSLISVAILTVGMLLLLSS